MELLATSLLLFLYSALTPTVAAQFSNATCNDDSRWMFNSRNQSPCVMASFLRAACDGNYNVRALPEGYVYTGPSDPQYASPCWCSSVTFSMYQACSLCQSQTSLQRWGVWTTNCTGLNAPTNGSFPREIPAGTAIPAWAYALYPQAATFSVEVVQQFMLTNTTEFTAPQAPSSVGGSPRPSSASTPSPVSSGNSSSSSSNAGAIAGGVVGGIVGLALIAALVFFFVRRRNKKPSQSPTQAHSYAKVETPTAQMMQCAPPPPNPPNPPQAAPVIVAPKPRHPPAPPPSFRNHTPTPLAMSVTPTPKPNNAQQVYMPRPGSTTMQSTGHPYMPEV